MRKDRKLSKVDRFKAGRSGATGFKTSRNKRDYMTQVSCSQNFIMGKKLIDRIVHLSNINHNDTVIEIGTGKGHLTEELCRRGDFVYSIEIDRKLYENSKEKLASHTLLLRRLLRN